MKYLWLAIGGILVWLSGGDQPFAIAMLLAPVFVLRFVRSSRGLAGYFTAVPVIALAFFVAFQSATLGGKAAFAISVLVGAVLELLPYSLDRWLVRRLAPLAATLVFPLASVSLGFLLVALGNATTGNVAYAFRHDLALIQVASVTGIWGIHFLVYWVASVIATLWENEWRVAEMRSAVAALSVCVVGVYLFGSGRIAWTDLGRESIQVAGATTTAEHRDALFRVILPLIQGEGDFDAQRVEVRRISQVTADALFDETRRLARAGADVVGWSETAVVCDALDEESILDDARRLAAEEKVYIALGLGVADLDAMKRAPEQPFVKNKVILITPDGSPGWEFMKSHLVTGDIEARTSIPGDGRLQYAATRFGSITGAVCYDLDYPDLSRDAGREGATLMVAPSNDWPQIKGLHADVAQFRAVENGFSLLRPTSNGLSIAVDPLGRVSGRVDYFMGDRDALFAQVPAGGCFTVYSRVGDLFAWLCVVGLVVVTVVGIRRRVSPLPQ